MPDRRRIAIDLQPLQGYSLRRLGIGRFVPELVTAIVSNHEEGVHSLLINPRRGIPPEVERFLGAGLVRAHSHVAPTVGGRTPDIYWATSPLEMDLTLDEIWPLWARDPSTDTVVALYDLIPTLFPDRYLDDPVWRALHRARMEFVDQADLLLCISEVTAADAIEHHALPSRRVANIETGVSDRFSLPDNPPGAIARACELIEELEPGFLMYTGGIDFRKNLPELFQSYLLLPDHVREERHLVVVYRVLQNDRNTLMSQARDLGIDRDALLTGFVPEGTLSVLYQSADLFVFPSIYEGFGLPIADAMPSGTLAIASDSSSMAELVTDPDLRFDPNDPADIARCIITALNEPGAEPCRSRQFTYIGDQFRWKEVADRRIEATESIVPKLFTHSRRRRGCIAMVTPIPPAESEIADYSWGLAHALALYLDVDVVAENSDVPGAPSSPNISLISRHGLLMRDELLVYNDVACVMDNSSYYSVAYELMDQRPGSLMVHEARFTGFFEWHGGNQGYEPSWSHRFLRQENQGIEPSLGQDG